MYEMLNDILAQSMNRIKGTKSPMSIKLILREFLRTHRQPERPTKIQLKGIPETFFEYLRCCGANAYVGKCFKENQNVTEHICAKINRSIEKNNKTAGFTVSDAVSFDWNWNIYPNVLSSTRFYSIAKTFLNISFETLYMSALDLLSMSYSSICVFLTNKMSEKLYQELATLDGITITAVTPKDIIDIGIAEDKLEFSFQQHPEVFLSCELSMSHTHIFDGGKELFHLPFHNMFCGSSTRFMGFEFERDICLNVIPRLEQHGVKIMVVHNPERTVNHVKINHRSPITPSYLQECSDENYRKVKQFLGEHYNDILDSIENGSVCLQHHIVARMDYQNKSVHYVSGERYTEGNRFNEKNSLYFFGPCIVNGDFVSDQETIPSFFRSMNENLDFVVHNFGSIWEWMGWNLRTPIYRKNDIVILFSYDPKLYEQYGITLTDISKAYYTLKSDLQKCVWDNALHCNAYINRNIAKLLYAEVDKRDWLKVQENHGGKHFRLLAAQKQSVSKEYVKKQPKLEEWLCRYKHPLADGTIGAICMNCNPMTNGHLYLIETAARSVDFLYVFILEEDKSVFRFEDRIQLVRDAVTHLPNVSVVPSGKFIISTSTLPGYFDKQNLQASIVDASYDLELFAESIAPALGITMRFAGEEPLDKFTAQYNYHMRKMLPLYGISFVEIPRKMSGNEVISASRVRKLMQQNQWEDIKHIVPDNVYQFLLSME